MDVSRLSSLPPSIRVRIPFLIAGFGSFLLSVFLYFIQDEELAGIFVGLWVPSIHSLGTLVAGAVDSGGRPTGAGSS